LKKIHNFLVMPKKSNLLETMKPEQKSRVDLQSAFRKTLGATPRYVSSLSETTGLLGCDFRYRHRRLELQKGPKISTMVVIDDVNLPLHSCSFVLGPI